MLTGARFGTSDIKRAIAFYDAVAKELGASRIIDRPGMVGYRGADGVLFMIGTPRKGEASYGNGSQVLFAAPSRVAVDSAHAAALTMGGTCEGAPGPRGALENAIYAAYFRDPDGNKVMVMRIGE
jgi:catechol 2,3-dioxygenase-like lactoylglutathione lyase family enzyme